MRIGQTTIVVFVSKLVGSVLGFAATIYFARLLGPTVLGYFALVFAILNWLKLGRSGIGSAVVKRMSEGSDQSAHFTAGALLISVVTLLMSGGLLFFEDAVAAYVGVPAAGFVVLLFVVSGFRMWVSSGLQGDHLVHVSALLGPVRQTVQAAVQIGLLAFGFGLTGMIVGHAVGTVLVTILGLFYLSTPLSTPSLGHAKSLVEYARYSWLGDVESRTFNDLDLVLLGLFVSQGLTGIYAVTWSIGNFLTTFENSIRSTLFPELSRQAEQGDKESVRTLLNDSLRYGGMVLIPGLVGGSVLSNRILRIYGPEFTEGSRVLTLLILSLLLYAYHKQLINTLNAINRPDIAFRINIVFIALNGILNVALIALYGIIGAAVATVLSAAVGLVLAYHQLNNLLGVEVPIREIGRQCIAALTMGVIVLAGRYLENTYNIVGYNLAVVAVLVGVGAVVYFGVLFGISLEFRRTVAQNIPLDRVSGFGEP